MNVVEQLKQCKDAKEATALIANVRKNYPEALLDEQVLKQFLSTLVQTFHQSSDQALSNWCVAMTAELFQGPDPVDDVLGELGVSHDDVLQRQSAEYRRLLTALQKMRLRDEELDRLLLHFNHQATP